MASEESSRELKGWVDPEDSSDHDLRIVSIGSIDIRDIGSIENVSRGLGSGGSL